MIGNLYKQSKQVFLRQVIFMMQWKTTEKSKEICKIVSAENGSSSRFLVAPCDTAYLEQPPSLGERYDVLELIGSGGMGTVWKVEDKVLNQFFAVKILRPEVLADEIARKRFEREALLAAELTHTNIAAVFGHGIDEIDRPYIIMHYAGGETLSQILQKEGPFPRERAKEIFSQLCAALSHCHMKGVIHRDIKPSNIIVEKTEFGDKVHLIDFGIAKSAYDNFASTDALTQSIDLFGSPQYMSPEHFLGSDVTAQSDIYSLGCVFYEMLVGHPPFTETHPVKLILQHSGEMPDLSKIPSDLQSIVYSCLAKEPMNRPNGADGLIKNLAENEKEVYGDSGAVEILHEVFAGILVFMLNVSGFWPNPVANITAVFLIVIVWSYCAFTNTQNAARTVNSRKNELVLFLAAFSSILLLPLNVLPQLHLQEILATPAAFLVAWLISKNKTMFYYEKLAAAIFSERLLPPSTIWKLGSPRMANFLFGSILLYITAQLTCWSVYCLCCYDYGINFVALHWLSSVSQLAMIGPLIVLRLITDCHTSLIKPKASLCRTAKLAGLTSAFSIVGTLVVLSALWQPGMVEIVRQRMLSTSEESSATNFRIRKEAFNTPNTVAGNMAKVDAIYGLWQLEIHRPETIKLSNEIVFGELKKDPALLAEAIRQNIQLQPFSDKNWQAVSPQVDLALANLEKAKQMSLLDFVRYYCIHDRFEDKAKIAKSFYQFATTYKDAERMSRAKAIMDQWSKSRGVL